MYQNYLQLFEYFHKCMYISYKGGKLEAREQRKRWIETKAREELNL